VSGPRALADGSGGAGGRPGLGAVALAAALAAGLALGSDASAQVPPGPGALSLTWSSTTARSGGPAVEGYVHNDTGWWVRRVQLAVEALDPSGGVVAEGIGHVDSPVPPGGRVYFQIPAPASVATYRLTVRSAEVFGRGSGP